MADPIRCRCRRFYCWLDGVTKCRVRWICNAHDAVIMGDDDD